MEQHNPTKEQCPSPEEVQRAKETGNPTYLNRTNISLFHRSALDDFLQALPGKDSISED